MYFYASNYILTLTADERGFEGGIVSMKPDEHICGHSGETFNKAASGQLLPVEGNKWRIVAKPNLVLVP